MWPSFRHFLPSSQLNKLPILFQSLCKLSTTPQPIQRGTESGTEVAIKSKEIIENVNQKIASSAGRMFAVVHLCGKQFKVTAGDVIIVEGYWAPQNGDRIRLDKVLIAGGHDFSLIGRPLVQPGLVDVQATIIEKTLSHTRTHFKKKRRKQYMRINFQRLENTMIRINSIDIVKKVNEIAAKTPDVPRIF